MKYKTIYTITFILQNSDKIIKEIAEIITVIIICLLYG